jgi:nucleotide-binding universal stress UspA family protein
MKIVCGTDFGVHAQSIARVAIDLAGRTSGTVELVHVADPAYAHIQSPSADVDAMERELRLRSEAKLAVQAEELAAICQRPVTFHFGEGDVETMLLERSKEIDADIIVVGAHGRPLVERLFLGSVTERIVRCADRPVLIVPPGVEGLGVSGDGKASALRIMVALDGRRASDGGVEFTRRLRSCTMCDLIFLRLYWPPEEYRRLGLTGRRDLDAPDPEVNADLERTLRMQVGSVRGDGMTVYSVEPAWGDPAAEIFRVAGEKGADVIVMGAESRHGLRRITHPAIANRVAHDAFGMPVLFVPPPAPAGTRSEVPRILTVLVATDLSDAGDRAVPFAYALVSAHGGVVELCHVHERALPNPPFAYDRADGKLPPEERSRIENELRALIPPDSERLGIATRVTVIDGGKAAEAIVQAAERFIVDAIVLGSRGGNGGAKELLFESVSHAVVHRTRRPVLVVPSPAEKVTAR